MDDLCFLIFVLNKVYLRNDKKYCVFILELWIKLINIWFDFFMVDFYEVVFNLLKYV